MPDPFYTVKELCAAPPPSSSSSAVWWLRAHRGDSRLHGQQQQRADGPPRPDGGGPGALPREARLVSGQNHGPLPGPRGPGALRHALHRPLQVLHGDGGHLQPQRYDLVVAI